MSPLTTRFTGISVAICMVCCTTALGQTTTDKPAGFNTLPFALKSIDGIGMATQDLNEKVVVRKPVVVQNQENGFQTGGSFSPRTSSDFNALKTSSPLNPTVSGSSTPSSYELTQGVVHFIDDIRLPAREIGVIQELSVREGDFVPKNTIIGKIDDAIYREMFNQTKKRFEIAKMVAEDDFGVRAAEKKYRVAFTEAKKARKLAETGSKSDSDRLMAIYTEELAKIEWEKAFKDGVKAKMEMQLAEAQMREIQAHLDRHALVVGFDGYVIEIIKHQQEHVNIGDEVLRIARMDELWVKAPVDVQSRNAYELMNRPVTITVELARNETRSFEGKIINVSLERQTRSKYQVTIEIKNEKMGDHWVLQPLMVADVKIHFDDNVGATSR